MVKTMTKTMAKTMAKTNATTMALRLLLNRLSSTIDGNREMDQSYTTSQVSNITRKTKFSLNG